MNSRGKKRISRGSGKRFGRRGKKALRGRDESHDGREGVKGRREYLLKLTLFWKQMNRMAQTGVGGKRGDFGGTLQQQMGREVCLLDDKRQPGTLEICILSRGYGRRGKVDECRSLDYHTKPKERNGG